MSKSLDLPLIQQHYLDAFNALFPAYSEERITRWIYEDHYGGWEDAGHTHAGGRRELIMLYCAIRAAKPKRILEIGTYRGDSTNHILLAAERNTKEGHACEVTTLDIKDYLHQGLHPFPYTRVIADSMKWLPQDFDFVFQDGNHSSKAVLAELQLFAQMPGLKTVFAHDCFLYPYIAQHYQSSQLFKSISLFNEPAYQAGFLIARK